MGFFFKKNASTTPRTFDCDDCEDRLSNPSEMDDDNFSVEDNNNAKNNTVFEGQEKQNQAVSWSRVLFFFVLAGAAAALASVVYVVLRNEEADDFEAKVSTVIS